MIEREFFVCVFYVPHVEAEQDLGRLKKKNGLPGSDTMLLRVNTGGTTQILIFKTLRMTGRLTVYKYGSSE